MLSVVEELRGKLAPVLKVPEPGRQEAREAFATGYVQRWATNLEKQIVEGPFLSGEKVHVADLKLFMVMKWFVTGGVDYIATDVFEPFPKLWALYEAVRNHPSVLDWYAQRKVTES